MAETTERKVLLSLKNVDVKFNVRGRILSAIRNVSLDIYEHESLAIVGESGSGKSVLTKTFAGLLDSNGFISNGTIIFSDDEISKTEVSLSGRNRWMLGRINAMLNKNSELERGAAEYVAYKSLKKEIELAQTVTAEEEKEYQKKIKSLSDTIIDETNYLGSLDRKSADDAEEIRTTTDKIARAKQERKSLEEAHKEHAKKRAESYKNDAARVKADQEKLHSLMQERKAKISVPDKEGNPHGLSDEVLERNKKIGYEVLLSIGRYPFRKQLLFLAKLDKAFRLSMSIGEDLTDAGVLNKIFESVTFRVEFRSIDEEKGILHGDSIIDCAKVKYTNDWQKIRGCRIATVFQDPMTSLNPVLTIGKQIMTVILKHQKCSNAEARERTIDIMRKVGIPDPEKRFNDYPFEYSGGMRQRIVIAIALSCQPKILICDEPTTALDVTIQAQIIRLIKDLQKDLGFTTVYITHDLGVVANVAERVAVLYGGQIVEVGTVEEIFYEPRHPYTWALLSSLPQLAERGEELFSIPGTPPSLYNKIKGDAFAPRNKYCLAVDLVQEAPIFHVSPTHWAKTWLLDERAPKVEPPESIRNLHEKMLRTYISFDNEEEEAANG